MPINVDNTLKYYRRRYLPPVNAAAQPWRHPHITVYIYVTVIKNSEIACQLNKYQSSVALFKPIGKEITMIHFFVVFIFYFEFF